MIHKSAQKLDPREQHYWIESSHQGMQLFLRYLPPLTRQADRVRPILYIHGATFPSALSIAHRFDGKSWRDALNEAGFDVWGLDFYGFGHSDRYREMDRPPGESEPLCDAKDAAEQVAAAARFILAEAGFRDTAEQPLDLVQGAL